MIDSFKEKIQISDKDDVIKLHIIIKSFQKNLKLSEADINSLIELNKTGYNDTFFHHCIDKGFYKSEQTIRNAISKMTRMGILSYTKRGERNLSTEFVPESKNDKLLIQYLVGNL